MGGLPGKCVAHGSDSGSLNITVDTACAAHPAHLVALRVLHAGPPAGVAVDHPLVPMAGRTGSFRTAQLP